MFWRTVREVKLEWRIRRLFIDPMFLAKDLYRRLKRSPTTLHSYIINDKIKDEFKEMVKTTIILVYILQFRR